MAALWQSLNKGRQQGMLHPSAASKVRYIHGGHLRDIPRVQVMVEGGRALEGLPQRRQPSRCSMHYLSGWLKEVAPWKVHANVVTLEVSHALRSWLKEYASQKVESNVVTPWRYPTRSGAG
eukprot:2646411-Prymnesium_polylepis.3